MEVTWEIIEGDCLEVMADMDPESVHCCVTSPPYWGLRDYGSEGQIGLEKTPEEYVAKMVEVFRAVRRVLRDDGVVFLNLGDSYATGGRGGHDTSDSFHGHKGHRGMAAAHRAPPGLKPKDLVGIPWRVALALQADGWYLRSDIIWCLSGGAWLYARTQKGVGPAMLKDLVRLDPDTVELWTGERWTNVTAWTKREGRANAFEIVLRSGERVGCTGEHLWPTKRGNVRACDLRKGDRIKMTTLPTSGKPAGWLTPEALWFAGLYLAEGSKFGETIQISGHAREAKRWQRIQALADHYGASARLYEDGNEQLIHLDRAGAINAILATLIGGRTAKDKHLAAATWSCGNWALKLIAEGYLEGDGHSDENRIRLGFTRNYALERDLRCLAARLGATLTLKPTFATNAQCRFPSFRGEWRWNRSGHHNEKDRGEVVEIRRSRARKFWDVSVFDSSSLFALASGVLTHNSKPNPMPESVTDRPTKSHEHIFLMTKSAKYFYDNEAVKEAAVGDHSHAGSSFRRSGSKREQAIPGHSRGTHRPDRSNTSYNGPARNKRDVWTVATQPFGEAHFAVFPPALIIPCIDAGTSEKGCCPLCGAPWMRMVGRNKIDRTSEVKPNKRDGGLTNEQGMDRTGLSHGKYTDWLRDNPSRTVGWKPSCDCGKDAVPCTVFDLFSGRGTTGIVATDRGRNYVGIDLSPEYVEMSRRLVGEANKQQRLNLTPRS